MSVAKSLSEEQIAQIQSWADDGADLPEIQSRLDSDLSVKVTYMEVRFLIDDLKIELKSDPPPAPEEEEEASDEEVAGDESVAEPDPGEDDSAAPTGDGQVIVTISELQRPGAVASGRVTFANGKGADWWMDQMGRLGMNADDTAYRPTEEDMLAFQQELSNAAKAKGL